MKICSVTLTAVFISCNSAWAQVPDWDENAVKQHCQNEWQDDFTMQAYCVNANRKGHSDFVRLARTAEETRFEKPFSKCIREWGIQWDMIAYCANQQVKGFQSLSSIVEGLPSGIAETILSKCGEEWRDDFSMIAYCAEAQSEAWHQLNN